MDFHKRYVTRNVLIIRKLIQIMIIAAIIQVLMYKQMIQKAIVLN